MAAGISTPRTTVASIRIAEAMPTPNILNSMSESVAKMANTDTMITAALVTTPALAPIPPVIASSDGSGDVTLSFTKIPDRVSVSDQFGDVTLLLPPGRTTYRVSAQNSFGSKSIGVPTMRRRRM